MSKRRPSPWVPLSVYYYDDGALIAAGEWAEVMFTRMLAYAGRHRAWNGSLPRAVVLSRLGLSALEGVPESVPETRLERLLESGLVTAQGPHVQIVGWLKWNEPGDQLEATRETDRSRKQAPTRHDAQPVPDDVPDPAPENAPEFVPNSGAQDKTRLDKNPSLRSGAAQAQPRGGRGTRLPEGWQPPDDVIEAMRAECPTIDLRFHHKQFTDFWRAKTGRDATKLDWPATWRKWMRSEQEKAGNLFTNGRRAGDIDWDAAMARAQAADQQAELIRGETQPTPRSDS